MILSERQYYVSQSELKKLKAALDASLSSVKNEDAWLREIETDGLRSQIADIEAEIAEYELLKSGQMAFSETCSLSELPRVLVQARLARGLSQTDLADQLNMKPQQIQRYEATGYMSASLARLIEVADALGVKISESFENPQATGLASLFSWTNPADIPWSRFPLKEMMKRRWFEVRPSQTPTLAAKEFFLSAAGPQFVSALHRKKVRSGSVPNEYALLAWQAQVLSLARRSFEQGLLQPFELNDTWLVELVALTRLDDGPVRARKLLAQHGIALVFERHLPGTYLDGAAMMSNFGHPVIALTLRHDRLDNFWFVLFHELGHVLLHLFENLHFDFFDEEDGHELDYLEDEADKFALNTLIPPELWDQCLSRFSLTREAVLIDAENLGIASSIVAGRIRKERNDYLILNDLVGRDRVRSLLEDTHE
jgi:HTH-type transcriptional regulator/antitoxin HigA